jgi:uncharacterized protein
MILVIDTSVILSALLSPTGHAAELIRLWEANAFDVAISAALVSEWERALQYPPLAGYLSHSQEALYAFTCQCKVFAITVEPPIRVKYGSEGPAVNRVLECALAGNANAIISGDPHLLNIKNYKGVEILTPEAFLTASQM